MHDANWLLDSRDASEEGREFMCHLSTGESVSSVKLQVYMRRSSESWQGSTITGVLSLGLSGIQNGGRNFDPFLSMVLLHSPIQHT